MSSNDRDDNGRTKKWILTANNPHLHGWEYDEIIKKLENWKALEYWCIGYEIGVEKNNPHYHIFIIGKNQIEWTTIHNKFKGMNRRMCNGSNLENKEYCFKIGKWLGTEKEKKHDHSLDKESGELPEEKGQGYRTDLKTLYDLIKNDWSTFEILEEYPQYIDQLDKIEKVRQTIREEKYKDTWRKLSVTYIFGNTGAGKTRSVMDEYGYSNVYRVTDYEHPFDSYKGQDVIIFEEFRSNLRIDDMLKYLDGYPVEFPARYVNKVACFTKVYIITNIDIREQYPNVQEQQPVTWQAFLRRIHKVKVFTGKDVQEFETAEYLKEEWRYAFGRKTPFDKEGV